MLEPSASADRRMSNAEGPRFGLFRSVIGGPGRHLADVFANLPAHPDSKIVAESPDRRSFAAHVEISRAAGAGRWDFYQLGDETFVVMGDSLFDHPRAEQTPGEDLVEFHLRLSGTMRLRSAGSTEPLVVGPGSLLVWRQPAGIEVQDRIESGARDIFLSLYCRPGYLQSMALRHGLEIPEELAFITGAPTASIRHLLRPLSPGLVLVVHGLLHSPLVGGLRLLHAETKATELLCEVLHASARSSPGPRSFSEDDLRRLDVARQIVTTQFSPPPLISDLARRIGMSETKLKRAFKLRFGTTIFDMSVDARMRHALELLRCRHMPVSRVALAVGYSHQTSFASAFKKHFGFLPRTARQDGVDRTL